MSKKKSSSIFGKLYTADEYKEKQQYGNLYTADEYKQVLAQREAENKRKAEQQRQQAERAKRIIGNYKMQRANPAPFAPGGKADRLVNGAATLKKMQEEAENPQAEKPADFRDWSMVDNLLNPKSKVNEQIAKRPQAEQKYWGQVRQNVSDALNNPRGSMTRADQLLKATTGNVAQKKQKNMDAMMRATQEGATDPVKNTRDYIYEYNTNRDNGRYTGNDLKRMSEAQLEQYVTQNRQALDEAKKKNENLEQQKADFLAFEMEEGKYRIMAEKGLPMMLDYNGEASPMSAEEWRAWDESNYTYLQGRPENYEGNTDLYDRAIYDWFHGNGAYQDRMDNGTDEEWEAAAEEVDDLWNKLESGEMKQIAANMWDEKYQKRTDYMNENNAGEYEQNVRAGEAELENRGKIRELEENAPEGYWPYKKELGNIEWSDWLDLNKMKMKDLYYYANMDLTEEDISDFQKYGNLRPAQFMTDEQLNTFNGYYLNGQYDEAQAYYDGLEPYLQQMKSEYQTVLEQQMYNNGWAIPMTAVRIATKPVEGVVGMIGTGAALLGNEEWRNKDSDVWGLSRTNMNIQNTSAEAWGKQFAEWFGGGDEGFAAQAGRFLNGVMFSIADNITAFALSGGASALNEAGAEKIASGLIQLVMSSEATASTMYEKINDGMDPTQAAFMAYGNGIIEAITEKYSLEQILDPNVRELLGTKGAFLRYLGKSALAEGSEEVASDLLDTGLDYVMSAIYGNKAELTRKYDDLVAGGMDPGEATRTVILEYLEQLGQSGMAGALSGLLMSGSRGVNTRINVSRENAQLATKAMQSGVDTETDTKVQKGQQAANLFKIIETGEGFRAGTETNALAKQIREEIRGGKNVDKAKVGQLVRTIVNESSDVVSNTMRNVLGDAFTEELNRAGIEGNYAENLKGALTDIIVDGNFDARSMQLIAGSPAAQKILSEFKMGGFQAQVQKAQELTQQESEAKQSVMEMIAEPKSSGVSADQTEAKMDGAEWLKKGDAELEQAQGKATGKAGEVVADGMIGTVVGFGTKTENGQTFATAMVEAAGKTTEVDLADVQATNEATAKVLQFMQTENGQSIGSNLGAAVMKIATAKNAAGVMSDAVNLMISDLTGTAAKVSTLNREQQQAIRTAIEQDNAEADAQAAQNKKELTPGEGKITYDGTTYGTKAFSEKLNGLGKGIRDEANYVARLMKSAGMNVDFYYNAEESENQGAFYGGEGIRINLAGTYNAQGVHRSIVATVGHEATHWLRANSPAAYRQMQKYVMQVQQKNGTDLQGALRHIMDNYEQYGEHLTMDKAAEELVAMSCEQIFTNEKLVNELQAEDPTLYGKIKQAVMRIVNRLREAITGNTQATSSRYAKRIQSTLDELGRVWKIAYEAAKGAEGTGEGTRVANSRKMDEEYDAAVNSGDMEASQKMVDQAAQKAGYIPLKLYHGTRAFGFTEFDVSGSQGMIFTTTDRRTAETYSNETERSKISEKSNIDYDSMDGEQLLQEAKKTMKKYSEYEIATQEQKENAKDNAREDLQQYADEIQDVINQYAEKLGQMRKKMAERVVEAVRQVAKVNTDEEFYEARNKYDSATWGFKWEDEDVFFEMLTDERSKNIYQALNKLSDFLYDGNIYIRDGDANDRIFDAQMSMELDAEQHKGVYELYGNPGRQLVIDAEGGNWNNITPPAELNLYGPQRTRDIGLAAKALGYDSVLIKNLRDNGGETAYNRPSDIRMFFSEKQLKSADTVTYDDNGNVIPLSERFNREKEDIRYSKRMDEEYDAAVKSGDMKAAQKYVEQAAENAGYTDKAYHGSQSFGFTEFDMEASQGAVFVAYSDELAGTYTEVNEVRDIKGPEKKDYDSMFSDELAEYAEDIITEDGKGYYLGDIELNVGQTYDGSGRGEIFNLIWEKWDEERGMDVDYIQIVSRDELIKMIEDKRNKEGIYQLYTKPGKQLVVNFNKDNWNRLPWSTVIQATNGEAEKWTDKLPYKLLKTRQLADLARKNGYDSVRLNNITDHGGRNIIDLDGLGDIGIFFNPNDVKSADTVVYDNKGEVIPPSERFNPEKSDIRWSMRDDTDYDVRQWMETVPEWSLKTEAEKTLLKKFGNLQTKAKLDRERMRKIDEEIRKVEGTLKGSNEASIQAKESIEGALESAGVFIKNGRWLSRENVIIGKVNEDGTITLNKETQERIYSELKSAGFQFVNRKGTLRAGEALNVPGTEQTAKETGILSFLGKKEAQRQLEALQVRKKNLQTVMDQNEEKLNEILSDEGFGRMMYQQQKVLDGLKQYETQGELKSAVEKMEDAVRNIQERISENKKAIEKLNSTDSMKQVREILESTTAKQAAADLKREYHSTWTQAQILPYISEIMAKMTAGEEYMDSVEELAEILMTSDSRNVYEGLSELKGLTITLGKREQRELKAKNSNIREIRQKLEGTGIMVRFGETSTLDTDVEDLRTEYPTMPKFGNDLNALDEFIDWVSGMRGRTEDEFYEQNKAEATAKVLQKVTGVMKNGKLYVPNDSRARQQIMDLVQYMKGLNAETAEAERTLAEVAAQLEEMKKTGAAASSRADLLMKNVNVALDYYNRISRIAVDEAKETKTNAIIEQLKSKHAEEIVKNNAEWRAQIQRDADSRKQLEENRKYQKQVNTNLKRMWKLLKEPKGLNNIPEYMQGLAREVISMFVNNDMGRGSRFLQATMEELADRRRILDAWDARDGKFDRSELNAMDPTNVKADVLLADVDKITEALKVLNSYQIYGKNKLDALQQRGAIIGEIRDAVSEIYSAIKAEQEVQIGDRKVAVEDAAYAVAQGTGGKTYREWTGSLGGTMRTLHKAIISGNMTPEYFFRTLDNAGLTDLWENYHIAENRNGLELKKSQDALANIAEEYGYKNWNMKQKITLNLESGDVTITLGQLMSLWATWKREQTLGPEMSEHLTKGGFFADVDLRDGLLGRQAVEKRAHRVTEEDMAKAKDLLTEEQRKFVDAVVGYMSRDMSTLGNEASMKAYGIKLYKESYYFPFQMWDGVKTRKSNDAGSAAGSQDRAFHPSFSKSRVHGANNAVMIGDFMQVATDHIAGMINYATMGLANESLNKVLNQQTTSGGEYETKRNTRAILEEAYGRDALKYLMDLKVQLEGGAVKIDKTFYDKLISLFRKNAVAGSLSVALQQPLSYMRAAMMIDSKYLARAISPDLWKGSYKEMLAHSGIAVIKEMGRFDMNFGASAREYLIPEGKEGKVQQTWDWITEKATVLPEMMDRMTWTRMWSAVKAEQKALHPEMDVKSDRFLDMCGVRFNDIMRRTQVYDSTLVKSANMRSQNPFMKTLTSFMAEPTLTANVLMDSYRQAVQGEKGGKLAAAKASAIFLLSAVCQAAVKGAMGARRNPDEKKTWGENFWYRFWYNAIGEMDPLQLIPGYSDLITVLKGGDIKDDAMGAVGKLFTAGGKVIDLITGKTTDAWRGVEDSVGQIVQLMSGLPMKNIMRDLRATWNWIGTDPYAKREDSAAVLKYQFMDTMANADNLIGTINSKLGEAGWETSNSAYYKRIYQAQKEGREQDAKDMIDYLLKGKGVKEVKTITSGVNSLAKKDDAKTPEERLDFLMENGGGQLGAYVAEMYEKGEIDRAEAERLYKKANPKAEEKDILKALDKVDYEKAGGTDESFSNYTRLEEAMDAGDAEQVKKEKEYLVSNGYEEKDVNDKMKGIVTDKYRKGEIDKAQAEEQLKKWRPDLSADDIFWTLDLIDYKNATGNTNTSGKYYRLWDAMDDNKADEIESAVSTMTKHGLEAKNIKSEIGKHYKQAYLAADSNGKRKIRDAMQKAYRKLGFTAQDADKTIENWEKKKN